MRTKPLITTALAATMALTPMLPTLAAHAATTTWNYQRMSIAVNGNQVSSPYRIVANGTTYMPIYYLDTLLR